MAALGATDRGLADHYTAYGRREGRVAQRLRVVLSYDATALEDDGTAHGRVSGQLYSLVGTMAIALQLGAEMVRRGIPNCVEHSSGAQGMHAACMNAHCVR